MLALKRHISVSVVCFTKKMIYENTVYLDSDCCIPGKNGNNKVTWKKLKCMVVGIISAYAYVLPLCLIFLRVLCGNSRGVYFDNVFCVTG